MSKTAEFKIWKGIKARCFRPKCDNFGAYGGRGITMCNGFKDDFFLFLKIVGKRPEGLEIDRIDNEGHYSCGQCDHCKQHKWSMNVRWVTHKENCRNTRRNKHITFAGKTQTLGEWGKETGIDRVNIARRLASGWSVKKALTTPPDMVGNQPDTLPNSLFKKIKTLYNSGKSLAEVAKEVNFGREAVRKCLVKQRIEIRSQSEQQTLRITSTSHLITFQGDTKTAAQWSRELGFRGNTITMRLRRGWSIEKTLTTPLRAW